MSILGQSTLEAVWMFSYIIMASVKLCIYRDSWCAFSRVRIGSAE